MKGSAYRKAELDAVVSQCIENEIFYNRLKKIRRKIIFTWQECYYCRT